MGFRLRTTRLKRGLSLIELIVAVSILVLLAALLVPQFSRMNDAASLSVCSTRLREVNLALLAYVSSNGGMFPWGNHKDPDAKDYLWPRLLLGGGYLSETTLLFCPAQQDWWHSMVNVSPSSNSVWPWSGVGYGSHRYGLMPSETDGPGRKRANIAGIHVLSSMISLRESHISAWTTRYDPPRDGGHWFTPGGNVPSRHGERFNVAFLDGHIEVATHEEEARWAAMGNNQPPYYKEMFVR